MFLTEARKMRAHTRAFGVVFFAVALALGACAPSSGPVTGPGDEGPGDEEGPRQLLLLGDGYRTVTEGAELVIEVRYVRADGAVIPQGLVEFAAEGDVAGASLAARIVETDNDGLASVVLRAGNATRMTVSATADGIEQPAVVTVEVVPAAFGDLQVTASYDGERSVRTVEMGLFTNLTCRDVVERTPSASDGRVTRVGATVTFERVEIGVPLAVFALGIDHHDHVASEGCVDVTLDDAQRVAEVALVDLPEQLGGTFDVVERFDVTDGVNGTLDTLLEAMSGLSSDPAQYIVAFVAGSDFAPDWLRSALSNPIMAAVVSSTLRGAVEGVEVPGLLRATVDLGADLDGALSGLVLAGELRVDEPDEFGSAPATHRILRMEVPVDGTMESRAVRAEADIRMPITPSFSMPEHSLELAFGTLVESILNEILLPRLPGEPHNLHGLMTQIFDCEEIAEWLVGDHSTAATLANAVCDAGVILLADEVQSMVLDLFEYDQLALSGTATLADTDQDYDRETISEGSLQASWTGASGELDFAGTMTGSLRDDTAGREHPVRARLQAIF